MYAKKIYGFIYLVKNKKNGKVYIGQTSQKGGFDRRYKNDIYKNTSNEYLKRSIKKYGIEQFEIIKEYDKAYSKTELDEKEIRYIEEFNSTDSKYGYNIKGGGSYGKLADSTKEKLRNVNIGKKYSYETNQKKARVGKENGMFGRTHSVEVRKIISQKKIGKYNGEESSRSRKIKCITTGKVFNCNREAGEFYNIKSYTHITRVCRGQLKSCGKLEDGTKLQWEYFNDSIYSDEEIRNRNLGALKRGRKILCKTTNKEFNSQREAGEYYGIKYFGHISEVCSGHSISCGKLPDGTPLKWEYLDK